MREERQKEGSKSEWTTSTTEMDPEQAKSLQTFKIGLSVVAFIMFIFIIVCYFIDKRKMDNSYDTKYSDENYDDDVYDLTYLDYYDDKDL